MKAEGGRMNEGEQPLEDLRSRTKRYALAAIDLYVRPSHAPQAQVMGRQMLRSSTSVGAHYREACRARSDAEFISKMEGGLQELDETAYWLELLIESHTHDTPDARQLLAESDESIRIFITMVKRRKD
jgi:four helix bundle protein